MPEEFYKKMDEMFEELCIELEDTDDKEKIKKSNNFVAIFIPSNPIVID